MKPKKQISPDLFDQRVTLINSDVAYKVVEKYLKVFRIFHLHDSPEVAKMRQKIKRKFKYEAKETD